MKPEVKLCVSLTDEVLVSLRSRFESVRHEELIHSAIHEAANILQSSGKPKKMKLSEFILEHIDEIAEEYSGEYPLWEARALMYASEHKHGVAHQLIEAIYCDKIWSKKP